MYAADAQNLGVALYDFYNQIGEPQEFAPAEFNDHPEERQPLIGFGRDDYEPEEMTPRVLLPGREDTAMRYLANGARAFLPQIRREIVGGAQLAAGLAGYGPQVAEFVGSRNFPFYSAGAVLAYRGWNWMMAQAKMQRDVAAQRKLEAIALKYPRVTGRSNFASPGNASRCSC